MKKTKFKDHFSKHSGEYQKFRPHYPASLFNYLASLCDHHELAWDCATGNGQAALALSPYFKKIIATDASSPQIEMAKAHPKITYGVAKAEDSKLATSSLDLIMVAQAVHWFDHERFYQEVQRVLNPNGVLAVWCYGLHQISPSIDAIIKKYYAEIVGPYWPPERQYIDDRLEKLPFPFPELTPPPFEINANWSFEQLWGYLGTWSATHRYHEAHHQDPRLEIRAPLASLWGKTNLCREIRWPLFLKVGQGTKIKH